jgi:hypothetical protein
MSADHHCSQGAQVDRGGFKERHVDRLVCWRRANISVTPNKRVTIKMIVVGLLLV